MVVGHLAGRVVDLAAAVVHPVQAAVFEHGDLLGAVALPRGVAHERDVLRDGAVQDALGAVQPVDQPVVDE